MCAVRSSLIFPALSECDFRLASASALSLRFGNQCITHVVECHLNAADSWAESDNERSSKSSIRGVA